MSHPRVSIVIPSYNHAHFLGAALDSVRAQTVTDWECVVVNNYSTDNTEAVVAAYDDPRIRLLNFRNEGVIAASRNVGIQATTGEWVAFLDSDDWWEADKLERCLAAAGPDTDVVSHPEFFFKNDIVIDTTQVADAARVAYRTLLFAGNCLSPSAIMIRRPLLERHGGFATDRELITAEDFELWLRLARDGARFAFVDKPLAYFRIHGGQNSGSIVRHRDASLAVLERHLDGLKDATVLDRLRGRRARALVVYAAGRGLQKAGRFSDALGQFARAAALWPLEPRLWAAVALALLRRA
jgi:glycosyltransferase involved in cell wall biosynthesis